MNFVYDTGLFIFSLRVNFLGLPVDEIAVAKSSTFRQNNNKKGSTPTCTTKSPLDEFKELFGVSGQKFSAIPLTCIRLFSCAIMQYAFVTLKAYCIIAQLKSLMQVRGMTENVWLLDEFKELFGVSGQKFSVIPLTCISCAIMQYACNVTY